MPLTRRQKEILDHIEAYIAEWGYAPSFEEIAEHFGYSSLATVHEHAGAAKHVGDQVVGEEGQDPAVQLGIKGRTEDGWYPLSLVTIQER